MKHQILTRLSVILTTILVWGVNMLHGQIATDGSLGFKTSLAGPAFQIPADLGTVRGPNLFHSFETFSLVAGESATFTGPNSIARVFSRVTGGNPSSIDGALNCAIPGANFYFLNSAGVVFGPNASVHVDGAFTVSTADQVKFADGGWFDARIPAYDVLTTANPVAFGFLPRASESVATIAVNGTQLTGAVGKDMMMAAGDIKVRADGVTQTPAVVKAPGGNLQVAAVQSAGELPLDGLNTDVFTSKGDISISGGSSLSSSGEGSGGRFLIRGHDLTLEGGSWIINDAKGNANVAPSDIAMTGRLRLTEWSSIEAKVKNSGDNGGLKIAADSVEILDRSYFSTENQGSGREGPLSIKAQNVLLDGGESFISSHVWSSGAGGDITIAADNVRLLNDGQLSAGTSGAGRSGNIAINAQTLQLQGSGTVIDGKPSLSRLQNDAKGASTGDAGMVEVNAKQILLDNGRISTDTYGAGKGGDVVIASEVLSIDGDGAGVSAMTDNLKGGAAGSIAIQSRTIELDHKGGINTDTFGAGQGGDIDITADTLALNHDAYIAANTDLLAHGDAGNVKIAAGEVTMQNGAVIGSSSRGYGRPGNVDLKVSGKCVVESDSLIDADTSWAGTDNTTGNIAVNAHDLEIREGGAISSFTHGEGDGGNVNIAANRLWLDEGFILANSTEKAKGDGGNVEIRAENFHVAGYIYVRTLGEGSGGTVSVAAGQLAVDGKGQEYGIYSGSEGAGGAGGIKVTADEVTLVNGGTVSCSATRANAGDIVIDSSGSIRFDDSVATVRADQGDAGTISLNAPQAIQLNRSTISAEAGRDGGNISLDPRFIGLTDSHLNANAKTGNGGHIEIATDFLYRLGDSSITAISENRSAQPGTVSIRSSLDFAGSLTAPSGGLVDDSHQVLEGCARKNPRANSLMVRGKGGVAVNPDFLFPVFDLRAPPKSGTER